MNTDQKLQQIVDKLLVKTQDNLCVWKKNKDNKFIYITPIATIELYYEVIIGGTSKIKLEINRDNTTLIEIFQDVNDINFDYHNLVRLFNEVEQYHQNYVNTFLDKMIVEIQKEF